MNRPRKTPASATGIWSETIGYAPYKVTVLEMPTRKRVLYLRWRERRAGGTNWAYESLGRTLADEQGRPLAGRALNDVKRWARERAKAKHQELVSGVKGETLEEAPPLTIRETWAKVSDSKTGLFPIDTPHRREVKRALDDAVRIWGGETLWLNIKKPQLMALGRVRVDELLASKARGDTRVGDGYRGAEIAVTRVLTVAQWLRDSDTIPADVAVPTKRWKEELRTYWAQALGVQRAPEVRRVRVTVEQLREVIKVAPRVDPRFHLAVHIGIGLRPGQVVRVMRSAVDLTAGEHGGFRVASYGKKKGVLRHFTKAMRATFDAAMGREGYLFALEQRYLTDAVDYPLFPAGQLTGGRAHRRGRPTAEDAPPSWRAPEHPIANVERHAARHIGRSTLGQWFQVARELAKLPEIPGLGLYSLKRAVVDGGKEAKISREGLQEIGGWTDTQMADMVYADSEREYARKEASDVLARVLGEED